jgi:hypothetical protein
MESALNVNRIYVFILNCVIKLLEKEEQMYLGIECFVVVGVVLVEDGRQKLVAAVGQLDVRSG